MSSIVTAYGITSVPQLTEGISENKHCMRCAVLQYVVHSFIISNMSQKDIMEILSNYEGDRNRITEEYFSKFTDIFQRFEQFYQECETSIEATSAENEERAKQIQEIASIAEQFYSKLLSLSKKP